MSLEVGECGAVAGRLLEIDTDLSVGSGLDRILGEGWPQQVPTQTLEATAVAHPTTFLTASLSTQLRREARVRGRRTRQHLPDVVRPGVHSLPSHGDVLTVIGR